MQSPLNRTFGLLLTLLSFVLTGADWPRFRGPNGSAASADRDLPTLWSNDAGVVWKTRLPGPGASSPITTGDRVFVTCYSGYGDDGFEATGEPNDLKRHVVCLNRRDGRIVWQKSIDAKLPEASYRPPGVSSHGYASSTPTTDGERVYVFFGKTGVIAFNLTGKQLWHTDVGSQLDRARFGSGASPVLYKNLLIVNASIEGEALVALDKRTGREVWKAPFTGYGGSWSTPILAKAEGGREDLVLALTDEVWGLNPETGKLRWYAITNHGQPICPSLVAKDGVVYAIGGRRGGAVAIRAGGKGDVSNTHVVWKANVGAYVPSPVLHDGHLYWTNDRGIAYCLNAKNGQVVYQQRLSGARGVYASAVVGDGKVYVVTRSKGTFVLAAKPKFEQAAHNELRADTSIFNASPAVSDGQLLIRSDQFLYCIGKN